MSSEVQTREKVHLEPGYILKLAVTLLATCVVVAGLLGVVNMVTKDRIAAINWEKTQAAMRAVVADPEGSTFSEALDLTDEMTAAASAGGGSLTEAYAVLTDGAPAGYALKIVASGSQGSIEMMVGLDGDGTVTGVSVVSHSETAGIGTKVVEDEATPSGIGVLSQFEGMSAADGTLSVGSNVDAISGATVSSKGVAAGVNAAIAVAGVLG